MQERASEACEAPHGPVDLPTVGTARTGLTPTIMSRTDTVLSPPDGVCYTFEELKELTTYESNAHCHNSRSSCYMPRDRACRGGASASRPAGPRGHSSFTGRKRRQPEEFSRQVGRVVFLSEGHDARLYD